MESEAGEAGNKIEGKKEKERERGKKDEFSETRDTEGSTRESRTNPLFVPLSFPFLQSLNRKRAGISCFPSNIASRFGQPAFCCTSLDKSRRHRSLVCWVTRTWRDSFNGGDDDDNGASLSMGRNSHKARPRRSKRPPSESNISVHRIQLLQTAAHQRGAAPCFYRLVRHTRHAYWGSRIRIYTPRKLNFTYENVSCFAGIPEARIKP